MRRAISITIGVGFGVLIVVAAFLLFLAIWVLPQHDAKSVRKALDDYN